MDTGSREAFLADSFQVPNDGHFTTYAAYILDPERDERAVVVLAKGGTQTEALRES